jgi:glycosyltransferase involved in cell wall biosynthesis
MVTVSIILPCYNGAKWIERAIQSILAQTEADFELIIVDDGSTDNSKALITSFLHDERIRYVYQKNQGFSGAINRGIIESRGQLIGFIGQDDIWLPNKIEIQLKYLVAHPQISLVYSPYYTIDSEEQLLSTVKSPKFSSKQKRIYKLFLNNYIGFETVLVKKYCFEKEGLLDQNLIVCSDHDMWLRIAEHFDIGYLDVPAVKKRQHGHQLSKKMDIILKDQFQIINKAVKNDSSLKKYERQKLASLLII